MSNIYINPYEPEWPKLYQSEKNRIIDSISSWINEIVHIGSTAVVGLSAKPTIDMCIGVNSLEKADQHIVPVLQQLDYDYLSHLEAQIPKRRYLQKLDEEGSHLFHIHVVLHKDELWNNHIRFRDYLMTHPEERQKYQDLKKELQRKFCTNREAYTEGKAAFIRNLLAKAVEWEKQNND